jgi:hypothetical protein
MKPSLSNNFDPMAPIVSKLWDKPTKRPFKTRIYALLDMQAITVLNFTTDKGLTFHRDEAWIGIRQWRRPDTIKDDFNKQIMGDPIGCDQLILRKAQLEAEIEQLENAMEANVDIPFLVEKYNQNNKWLNLVNDLIENKKCRK